MSWNEKKVLDLLRTIEVPGTKKNIVEYGIVQGISLQGNEVALLLEFLGRDPRVADDVASQVDALLRRNNLVPRLDIRMKAIQIPAKGTTAPGTPLGPHGTSPDPWADRQPVPGVRHVLAVASAKGGVGKSTVAVNLALSFLRLGIRVGLMDADIYGPSIPIMLGIREVEIAGDPETRKMLPVQAYGLKTISIGYLIHDEQPVIWRGPLVQKTLEQFLRGVHWGELDLLVVDLPPGTGDAPLSLVQKTVLDGVVLVTTPQDVALADVIRGHAMFTKVDVPVLGVLENMSYFICPHCGTRSNIFDTGGGRREAERRGIRFLGEIPLDPRLREGMDAGKPLVAGDPDHPISSIFLEIARKLWEEITRRSQEAPAQPLHPVS